jgi:hypothetical protein
MLESSAFKPNDKLNWGCKIRDILCKYGFNHVWLSQNVVNEDIFMLQYKQRVIDTVSISTPLWKPHTSHP